MFFFLLMHCILIGIVSTCLWALSKKNFCHLFGQTIKRILSYLGGLSSLFCNRELSAFWVLLLLSLCDTVSCILCIDSLETSSDSSGLEVRFDMMSSHWFCMLSVWIRNPFWNLHFHLSGQELLFGWSHCLDLCRFIMILFPCHVLMGDNWSQAGSVRIYNPYYLSRGGANLGQTKRSIVFERGTEDCVPLFSLSLWSF